MQKKSTFGRLKQASKKVWHYIWEDDSLGSWILNIILAFILIKFLVYPSLGFMLGTSHPIVAVVSGSMEHNGDFDAWWDSPSCCKDNACVYLFSQQSIYEQTNIDNERFKEFPFMNGFNTGDIMILIRAKDINIGDIIVFQTRSNRDPIIHRVVQKKVNNQKRFYKTKGDNNCGSSAFEQQVSENVIIGKAWLRIPFLGYIKILFVKLLKLVWVI